MLIDDGPTPAAPAALLPKKLTRAQQIKALLDQQPTQPVPGQHQLAETTGYLKCLVCGINIHKRVNEGTFNTFIHSPCVNQAYTAAHQGHTSHALWQVGERVKCTQCGTQWNLDGQQRILATQALHKPCKGASTKVSTPLSEFFKKKDPSSSQSPELHQPATTATAAQPTPKRLSFQTALDAREQEEELTNSMSALAMNPSPSADAEPDTHDDQPGFAVEYF